MYGTASRTSRSIKETGVCIRRGDVGIAPYTHNPAESTHVGDGLRTSRNYNNGIMIHLCPLSVNA